jgi:hypothetical protein
MIHIAFNCSCDATSNKRSDANKLIQQLKRMLTVVRAKGYLERATTLAICMKGYEEGAWHDTNI